jgi:hypothetical protein
VRFVNFEQVARFFCGKKVAVVGSGPGVLDNEVGFIDSHDVVVRVNNYKNGEAQGFRTDVHYSFYGTSIRKTANDLQNDGVKLCMAKCPDSKPLQSEWHERMQKQAGIDFRYIYRNRSQFWFCDTFIPDDERFLKKFELLDKHIPTTGFAGILDVLACDPRSVYLTGFDFFSSGVHNVDEKWRAGNPCDPIGHRPDLEIAWLRRNEGSFPLTLDNRLSKLVTND